MTTNPTTVTPTPMEDLLLLLRYLHHRTGSKTVVATQGDTSVSKPFTVTSATSPAITLNPTSGPVGTSVIVTGTGFDPSSVVSIYFDGDSLTTNPCYSDT